MNDISNCENPNLKQQALQRNRENSHLDRQTHVLLVCEIISWCVYLVTCVTAVLKEPGDSEKEVITARMFPHFLICVFVSSVCCARVVFLHFHCVSPSLNSTLFFHPPHKHTHTHLPPPASLSPVERATDPLGGQINSLVRATQSAEGPSYRARSASHINTPAFAH